MAIKEFLDTSGMNRVWKQVISQFSSKMEVDAEVASSKTRIIDDIEIYPDDFVEQTADFPEDHPFKLTVADTDIVASDFLLISLPNEIRGLFDEDVTVIDGGFYLYASEVPENPFTPLVLVFKEGYKKLTTDANGMVTFDLSDYVKTKDMKTALKNYVNKDDAEEFTPDKIATLVKAGFDNAASGYTTEERRDLYIQALEKLACPHRIGDYFFTDNEEDPAISWPGTKWENVTTEVAASCWKRIS